MIRRIIVALVGVTGVIALPASVLAAPAPGPLPSWNPTFDNLVPAQKPTPPTPPANVPPPASSSGPAQNTTPNLRVSCKRHSNHRWTCTVRTTKSSKAVTRCSGRGRVTAARRNACRKKALKKLGIAALRKLDGAPKAHGAQFQVPQGTREPPFVVCGDSYTSGAYADIQIGHPVIVPRDDSQDGWTGYAARLIYFDPNTGGWYPYPEISTTGVFEHFFSADVFARGLEKYDDWFYLPDPSTYPYDGSFRWTVAKGYIYAVQSVLVWFPQPSHPDFQTVTVLAHQTAYGNGTGDATCLLL